MNYILASKNKKGVFRAEEIVSQLDLFLSGVEYGDAAEGEVQLWEFPGGTIFEVRPDRELAANRYYALPFGAQGIVWRPMLKALSRNPELVEQAYRHLASQ